MDIRISNNQLYDLQKGQVTVPRQHRIVLSCLRKIYYKALYWILIQDLFNIHHSVVDTTEQWRGGSTLT